MSNWYRHEVAKRLRALASVGAIADSEDFAELHLTGAGRDALRDASKRCAELYASGDRARAIALAEELGADVVDALPAEQRDINYVRHANDPARGVTDPAALAALVRR